MSELDPTSGPRPADPSPSPVEVGAEVGGWTVGARYEVRGDLHLHLAASPEPMRIAVWRYRGFEPLPRFLEQLRADAEAWGAFHTEDGSMAPVVPTVDVARIVGQMVFYWAQEDPRGPTLATRLEQNTALSPGFAVDVARQLGAALVEIHARGLVHGDLDPHNVHLAGSLDFVRLAWGGLATRLERAGVDVGRGRGRGLAEVAPEVLMGRPPTQRSDLYALAALTFRMLAGQPPWLVRRNGPLPGVTADDPLPPLPEWVVSPIPDLLAIALQRDPDLRPASVADWCDRLAQAASAVELLPAPPGTWAPPEHGGVQPTPPTVNRTLSPMERLMAPDPALANTPPTAHGYLPGAAPTPIPGVRSVVPALARSATPALSASTGVTTLPPPERVVPPPPRAPAGPQLAPYALGSMMVVGFTAVLAAILCGLPFGRAPTPQPPAPPIVIQAAPPAPTALSAPVATQVTLYSDPASADVLRDGQRVGVTPMAVDLPAEGEPPLQFELRKAGHRTRTVEVGWSADPQDVKVELPSVRPAEVPPPVAEPPSDELPALRQR